MARPMVIGAGLVAMLLGALFALQGLGFVGGSFMTNDRLRVVIGIVLVVGGIAVGSGGRR